MQRNDPTWRRLAQLSRTGTGRVGRLSDDEIGELIALYQRVSGHLSHVRTQYGDPELNARLSQLLGEARNVIYRRRRNALNSVVMFFTTTFPAAVWHTRRFLAVSAACLLLPAIAMGIWLTNSDKTLDAAVDPSLQQLIAQEQFSDYYSSEAAQNFSGKVMINNIQVAFLAFALGVIVIVGPVWILVSNGMNIGVMAAVMHHSGEASQFWGLILPHGLLEIASIIVAGAAGLRLSWSVIAPGDRSRSKAFTNEGSRAVVIVLGLAVNFVVAGFIEGFVTPSGLPTSLRIAVGVAAFAAFATYVTMLGSRAERLGHTGLLGEEPHHEMDRALAAATSDQIVSI